MSGGMWFNGGWPTHRIEPAHRVPHSCSLTAWVGIRARREPPQDRRVPHPTDSVLLSQPL